MPSISEDHAEPRPRPWTCTRLRETARYLAKVSAPGLVQDLREFVCCGRRNRPLRGQCPRYLPTGARPFVVQRAFEMTCAARVVLLALTPRTRSRITS